MAITIHACSCVQWYTLCYTAIHREANHQCLFIITTCLQLKQRLMHHRIIPTPFHPCCNTCPPKKPDPHGMSPRTSPHTKFRHPSKPKNYSLKKTSYRSQFLKLNTYTDIRVIASRRTEVTCLPTY